MTFPKISLLITLAFLACTPEIASPTDRTCDANGCVCNEGLTACGDDCADLSTNSIHCGECNLKVFDVGGSGCRNSEPFCATSTQLCTGDTPVCSDFGCRERPIFNCDPRQSNCTDARLCTFDNFANLYDCTRQECADDLDCESFDAICEDDVCVSG